MKIPVLLRLAWAAQRSEAREVFRIAPLARTQTERHRRLALATGFGSQAVWNRSKRSAGARGGAGPDVGGEPDRVRSIIESQQILL